MMQVKSMCVCLFSCMYQCLVNIWEMVLLPNTFDENTKTEKVRKEVIMKEKKEKKNNSSEKGKKNMEEEQKGKNKYI